MRRRVEKLIINNTHTIICCCFNLPHMTLFSLRSWCGFSSLLPSVGAHAHIGGRHTCQFFPRIMCAIAVHSQYDSVVVLGCRNLAVGWRAIIFYGIFCMRRARKIRFFFSRSDAACIQRIPIHVNRMCASERAKCGARGEENATLYAVGHEKRAKNATWKQKKIIRSRNQRVTMNV